MAIRVGTDLVSVESVRDSIRAHRARYLERVYTERELSDCRTQTGFSPARLAARFAAKEATLKVLRPGDDDPVAWRSIEVCRASSGWVELRLTGAAAALAADAGVSELALSISHESGFATAVVVAECTVRAAPANTMRCS
ncbi:MAG TPA: holo-ACP synthase [Solirubrobacteraceae bacterium]|nr:holo-ACP synthase [Solirubrobacteraceae bacterium]